MNKFKRAVAVALAAIGVAVLAPAPTAQAGPIIWSRECRADQWRDRDGVLHPVRLCIGARVDDEASRQIVRSAHAWVLGPRKVRMHVRIQRWRIPPNEKFWASSLEPIRGGRNRGYDDGLDSLVGWESRHKLKGWFVHPGGRKKVVVLDLPRII